MIILYVSCGRYRDSNEARIEGEGYAPSCRHSPNSPFVFNGNDDGNFQVEQFMEFGEIETVPSHKLILNL
jgi:hypothetical protein